MRISGGTFRGRKLKIPARAVRPTQDRVREAIFSSLAARIPGARVLDLYAGTGALGLEAWSRGAESVVFVDKSPAQCRIIRENIRNLAGASPVSWPVFTSDAVSWLGKNADAFCFDLIFADPPYGEAPDGLEKTLHALAHHPMLASGGILVFELATRNAIEVHPPWHILKDKAYGKTRVLQIVKNIEPTT